MKIYNNINIKAEALKRIKYLENEIKVVEKASNGNHDYGYDLCMRPLQEELANLKRNLPYFKEKN